jgi:hypothetical protein
LPIGARPIALSGADELDHVALVVELPRKAKPVVLRERHAVCVPAGVGHAFNAYDHLSLLVIFNKSR